MPCNSCWHSRSETDTSKQCSLCTPLSYLPPHTAGGEEGEGRREVEKEQTRSNCYFFYFLFLCEVVMHLLLCPVCNYHIGVCKARFSYRNWFGSAGGGGIYSIYLFFFFFFSFLEIELKWEIYPWSS